MRGKQKELRLGYGKDLGFYSGWDVKSLEGVELRSDRATVLRIDCWQAKGEEEIMVTCTGK